MAAAATAGGQLDQRQVGRRRLRHRPDLPSRQREPAVRTYRRWRRVPLERDQLDVDAHHRRHRFRLGRGRFPRRRKPALDPNNDQLVYMVTGITVTQGHNGRIYISSNRGDTWTHYDLPFPVGGNDNGRATSERLQVDPNNPSTLFYGSRTAGLWKSADSGRTHAGHGSVLHHDQRRQFPDRRRTGDLRYVGQGEWPADLDHVGHRRPGLRQRGGPDVDPVQVHQRRLLVDAGARPADGVRLLHPARRAHVRRQLLRGVQRGRQASAGRAISTSSAEATTATGRCSTAPAATALAACPSPVWARPPASHWA